MKTDTDALETFHPTDAWLPFLSTLVLGATCWFAIFARDANYMSNRLFGIHNEYTIPKIVTCAVMMIAIVGAAIFFKQKAGAMGSVLGVTAGFALGFGVTLLPASPMGHTFLDLGFLVAALLVVLSIAAVIITRVHSTWQKRGAE